MAIDSDSDQPPARGGAYDYSGPVVVEYAPERDGEADPGEIVWAWVPYEELDGRGKDRPVVVLGFADTAERDYAVLMVSSRDHSAHEEWLSIGSGAWDPDGRESYVRLDRLLAVAGPAVRREGSAMSERQFAAVVEAMADSLDDLRR